MLLPSEQVLILFLPLLIDPLQMPVQLVVDWTVVLGGGVVLQPLPHKEPVACWKCYLEHGRIRRCRAVYGERQ